MTKYSTIVTQESDLLRPVDPAKHSDDWPIFTLKSVEVFHSDSSPDMVSLLTANATTPLTIRGKLPPIPRGLAHLRLRATSGGIEQFHLREVRQFSYGQYDDGEIEIWAAGKAGWYSIKPSNVYSKIYEDMVEAVRLMYFCTDQHASAARKYTAKSRAKAWAAITAESILNKYAQERGLGGRDGAAALFRKHARFLLSTMMRATKQDGIVWEKTNLLRWMEREFSDVAAEVREQREGALQAVPPQEKAGTKRKRSSVATPMADTAGASTPNDTSDTESTASTKRRGRKGKSILRPRTTSKYFESLAEDASELGLNLMTAEAPTFEGSPLARAKSRAAPSVAPSDAEFDEGIDMPMDVEQTRDDISVSSIHVRIRPEHLRATRPGDIWTCPLDGCMHQIYAASQSQQLIKEHYRLHVEDEDAEIRLELVRKMQAPGLPVNRLLSQIQKAGQRGFPSPIVQRY